jgi:hypothetical protein
MVSHERTYLSKLREKGQTEPESTLEHLDTLVQQYPYFQALHHLGWQIAKNLKFKEEETLRKTSSLYTKNRLHLIPNPEVTKEFISLANESDSFDEVRSFVDWLHQLEGTILLQTEEGRLVDKFIANAPKIVVSKSSEKQQDLTKKQYFNEQALMTETLAEIYFKQGKFKKAKKAFEILALKYPEKSGFFADQIRKITNAQNQN